MKKKAFIVILAALFMVGCSSRNTNSTETTHDHQHEPGADPEHMNESEETHENEATDEHDHEPEEEIKTNITAYSASFEVFAEADPLVAGETAGFLSHFTHLSDFSALDSGKVTLSLTVNGTETSQTLSHPLRKGIYSFSIEPEVAGIGEIIFDIATNFGNEKIVVPNVTVYTNHEDANKAAEAAEPPATNATVFTKEQSWKIKFATELPEIIPFGEVIKTTAQVKSAQNDEMVLTSKTDGVVLFSNNAVLAGSPVSLGQTLFTISGSNFADNNSTVRFLEAKNNYERARLDYQRIQALADEKIVSQKELLEAQNTLENTEAVFNNLNKNFSASGQTVKSPITGFVKHLNVQNGEFVKAGQSIAVVSQNKNLLLYAEVQPTYANDLAFLQTANIETANKQKTYSLEELNGKIVSWGKSSNHDNFLVPVNLQIENNGEFFPGSFVKTFLKTRSNQQALTIPVSALLEEQGLYYVFVQITPELFEKREIQTGGSDGIRIEILDGLNPNERIVTKGAVFIKLSQASGALDPHAGHVH